MMLSTSHDDQVTGWRDEIGALLATRTEPFRSVALHAKMTRPPDDDDLYGMFMVGSIIRENGFLPHDGLWRRDPETVAAAELRLWEAALLYGLRRAQVDDQGDDDFANVEVMYSVVDEPV